MDKPFDSSGPLFRDTKGSNCLESLSSGFDRKTGVFFPRLGHLELVVVL